TAGQHSVSLSRPSQGIPWHAGLVRIKRLHPMISARISVALHRIGAGVLALFGAGAASSAFAILHGSGSGIFTIARGGVPLEMFGPESYGYRLGLLGAPTRIAMAAAPVVFGSLIERYGAAALVFSLGLSIAALLPLSSRRITVARDQKPISGSGRSG